MTCSSCPRQVKPAEATWSTRTLGAVLCWTCRRQRPAAIIPEPACPQLVATVETLGYGLWRVHLRDPRDGRSWWGGGITPELARFRAHLQRAAELSAERKGDSDPFAQSGKIGNKPVGAGL